MPPCSVLYHTKYWHPFATQVVEVDGTTPAVTFMILRTSFHMYERDNVCGLFLM